ncbi:MAG TPA: TetR/AcrR family transcriptional regulator [Caulobacteraceae bacterium]|nr:TetR/AcrR family transcriptional regulator [Caulobacteraceae bacterium]
MPLSSSQASVTPRKTPSQSRSRATVEAVLSAAARILEEEGVAGFNTNVVAQRAGVSIGSLYQYFPGKDAIFLALMEQSSAQFSDDMVEAIDAAPGQSLAQDVMFMLQMGLMSHTRRPNLMRLLEGEIERLEKHMDRTSQVAVRDAIVRMLEHHRERIRPGDPVILAQDLGAIARVLMSAAGKRHEADWQAVIERTARAVVGYLGAAWDAPEDLAALQIAPRT